jgi:hypothetical protein
MSESCGVAIAGKGPGGLAASVRLHLHRIDRIGQKDVPMEMAFFVLSQRRG